MNGKYYLPTAAFATIALPMVAGEADAPKSSEKPKTNVIVILVDDQGYGGVSCYPHNKRTDTPNIDRLAAEGVRFTQGYTSGHLSSPTRAGLLTGCYQQSFGFYDLESPSVGGVVGQRIVSEYMKEAGYNTAAIGKWHVGDYLSNHPNQRGFDYFYGFIDGVHDYFNPIVGGSWNGWMNGVAYMMENDNPVVKMKYATYEFTDRAINFIEKNADSPFFLYLPYNAIHSPLQAPDDIIKATAANPQKPSKEDLVYAMTVAMDNSIGRILQTLDDKNLSDHTLVFYVSDNGGVESGDNWNLHGRKGSYYEGGIRVPFIMRLPGVVPAGVTYDNPVITLDITPTILSVANISHETMDGVNLVDWVCGKESGTPHQTLYWSNVKKSDTKVEKNEFAIRQGRWKLVSDPNVVKDCDLYDIEADPFEKNGLKKVYPDKYKELFNSYLDWINSMEQSLATRGTRRIDGKAMMNRYERNYQKEYGRRPVIRVVDIAADSEESEK